MEQRCKDCYFFDNCTYEEDCEDFTRVELQMTDDDVEKFLDIDFINFKNDWFKYIKQYN